MAYRVKLFPYGKYTANSAMVSEATEFGFPTTFISGINFKTNYGYLLFQGDSEVEGVKFYHCSRLDNTNSPESTCWNNVMDSDGNTPKDANGTNYGIPAMASGLTSLSTESTYFIGNIISPACGKIDGAYLIPFQGTRGKYIEFNGKKYVTSGKQGGSDVSWLISADPTE